MTVEKKDVYGNYVINRDMFPENKQTGNTIIIGLPLKKMTVFIFMKQKMQQL